MQADPAAFRERALARLRGEVVEQPRHDDATALGRKRNRNTVRNGQRRKAITPWQWKRTLAAFNGLCAYCAAEGCEREHFIPVLLGGDLRPQNCLPSCVSCNRKKRDTHPLFWLIERYGFISGMGLYAELAMWLANQPAQSAPFQRPSRA